MTLKERIKELAGEGCDIAFGTVDGHSWIYIGWATPRIKEEAADAEVRLKRRAAAAVHTIAAAKKRVKAIDAQLAKADEQAAKVLRKKRNDSTRHIAKCTGVAALYGADPLPILQRQVVDEYPYVKAFWRDGRKCICLLVEGYESGKYWSIEECMGIDVKRSYGY